MVPFWFLGATMKNVACCLHHRHWSKITDTGVLRQFRTWTSVISPTEQGCRKEYSSVNCWNVQIGAKYLTETKSRQDTCGYGGKRKIFLKKEKKTNHKHYLFVTSKLFSQFLFLFVFIMVSRHPLLVSVLLHRIFPNYCDLYTLSPLHIFLSGIYLGEVKDVTDKS